MWCIVCDVLYLQVASAEAVWAEPVWAVWAVASVASAEVVSVVSAV
jgi:hypothetical protein